MIQMLLDLTIEGFLITPPHLSRPLVHMSRWRVSSLSPFIDPNKEEAASVAAQTDLQSCISYGVPFKR